MQGWVPVSWLKNSPGDIYPQINNPVFYYFFSPAFDSVFNQYTSDFVFLNLLFALFVFNSFIGMDLNVHSEMPK